MSDRFKFRIYDPRINMMLEDGFCFTDRVMVKNGQLVITEKDCLIIQCTGHKDNNNTLVFEGDIIKVQDEFEDYKIPETYLTVIEWVEEDARFICSDEYSNCGGEFTDFILDCEVVGNIYENKDLLKGDSDE